MTEIHTKAYITDKVNVSVNASIFLNVLMFNTCIDFLILAVRIIICVGLYDQIKYRIIKKPSNLFNVYIPCKQHYLSN